MGKIRLDRHSVRDGNDKHARTKYRRSAVHKVFQYQALGGCISRFSAALRNRAGSGLTGRLSSRQTTVLK